MIPKEPPIVKSHALLVVAGIVAALVSVAANAQTGRPATVEVQNATDAPHDVVADVQVGSYARYLMLNGVTRDEAIAAARNVDHASTRTLLALRSKTPRATPAPANQ